MMVQNDENFFLVRKRITMSFLLEWKINGQKSKISDKYVSFVTYNPKHLVSFQFCLLQRFSFTTSQHCAHAPVRFRHTTGLVRVRKRCLPSNILVTANRAGEVLTTNVVKH